MVHIRFWWPGYTPEEALTSFDLSILQMPFEVSVDGGQTWRSPRDDATLQSVYDWMIDEQQSVVDTDLVDERRNGRWEGQYVLTLSKGGDECTA